MQKGWMLVLFCSKISVIMSWWDLSYTDTNLIYIRPYVICIVSYYNLLCWMKRECMLTHPHQGKNRLTLIHSFQFCLSVYLKGTVICIKKDRDLWSTDLLTKCLQWPVWSRLKPGVWNSRGLLHGWKRPKHWSHPVLPPTLTRSWNLPPHPRWEVGIPSAISCAIYLPMILILMNKK